MVTTYQNTAYLLQALANGAAGFILKDIPQEDLIATVKAVEAGDSQVDQSFLESVLRDLNEGESQQVIELELPEPLTPREMDVLRGADQSGDCRGLGAKFEHSQKLCASGFQKARCVRSHVGGRQSDPVGPS